MPPEISTRVLLDAVSTGDPDEQVTLGWFLDEFSTRAFGVLLLAATLISFIPLPVGVGAIAGPMVSLVGLQMVLMLPRPWIPRLLARRGLRRASIRRFRDRLAPWLARLERVTRPRAERMFSPSAEAFTGILLVALGFLLALPIPLTNYPFGLVLLVFCFALIERDGVLLGIAWVLGATEIAACILLSTEVVQLVQKVLASLGWT